MPPPAVSCSAAAVATRRVLSRPLRPTALAVKSTTTPSPTITRSIAHSSRPTASSPFHSRPSQLKPTCQPSPATPLLRTYHSHSHPPPAGPFTPAEAQLLSAAYAHVPAHGFTPDALALGARDTGLLDISPAILPDGVFSLIQWHLHAQRTALAGKVGDVLAERVVKGRSRGNLTVAEKVEAITWARLRGNEESGVIGRWQEALAIMAQPSYVPASLKELAQLADEILYLAGDVSVDPSWYTKRASLSTIYAAAELFQTTDTSPELRETRAFLRRRLDEAAQAGGAVRSVGEWLGFNAGAVVNVLRSKGVRI
ncbi:COQ9-domain-containing protein [Staphylotrichum tortipilum]|uniref:Ubiquinone biosynthesis protein n=1 Tax=Staphylotrichum tortipilum TaxID=2831512 RepID=A0AAN6MSH7_9PEZI|nr:COQ9-domain-containing protein [Staphylotrichum longicolle]